jgi:hypothetical protein
MKITLTRTPQGLLPADDATAKALENLALGERIEVDAPSLTGSPATSAQKRALHLWCRLVADYLNAHGIGMKAVFAVKAVDVPWNDVMVKNALFRPLYTAISGHDSTTMADTKHYGETERVLSHKLAEALGITLPPWPRRPTDQEQDALSGRWDR